MSVHSKMTAIADEIRTLSGKTDTMGLDVMASSVQDANSEITTQYGLLVEIMDVLGIEQAYISNASQLSKNTVFLQDVLENLNNSPSDPSDPTILYQLASPITFSNASPTAIETGVQLFDTAKDATVFINFEASSVIQSATLLYTNTGTTAWYPPGMFISTSGEYIQLGVHKITFKGADANYKHGMGNVNAIAVVLTAGVPTLVKFREVNGTVRTWPVPSGITFAATDGTLTLGAATGNTQGLYTQGFDGTVKDFRVWNVAKTEAEINALFAEMS